MAIAATLVTNRTCNPITLPSPYQGILGQGIGQVLLTSKAAFLAACGGTQGAVGLDIVDYSDAPEAVLLAALAQPGAGIFQAARGASLANINVASAPSSIGGVSPSASANPDQRRFLLAGQSDTTQNGMWVWSATAAAMTRATDMPAGAVVKPGALVTVRDGTYADTVWQVTNATEVVIGTDSLTAASTTSSGALTTSNLSDAAPAAVGTAAAGVSGNVSRADHVHAVAPAALAANSMTVSEQQRINVGDGVAVQRKTYSIPYTDLTDTAGLTKTLTFAALGFGGVPVATVIETTAGFAGGAMVSIGASAGVTGFPAGLSAEVAVSGVDITNDPTGTAGPTYLSAAMTPTITFTSVGANLDQLTAGQAYLHIYIVPVTTAA